MNSVYETTIIDTGRCRPIIINEAHHEISGNFLLLATDVTTPDYTVQSKPAPSALSIYLGKCLKIQHIVPKPINTVRGIQA